MKQFILNPVGTIQVDGQKTCIVLEKAYWKALQALEGFGHVQVLWWFDGCDDEASRAFTEVPCPYQGAPDVMGVFATRSPMRPNPIALTPAQVLHIDHENGILEIGFIDANDGTPVLDIKPYTPSFDRVRNPQVPDWCKGWPKSLEESGEFDWEGVFNF